MKKLMLLIDYRSKKKKKSEPNLTNRQCFVTREKKVFMKTILISNLHNPKTHSTEEENVYEFFVDFFSKPLYLRENKLTKRKVLMQDNYFLEDDQQICNLLFEKLV